MMSKESFPPPDSNSNNGCRQSSNRQRLRTNAMDEADIAMSPTSTLSRNSDSTDSQHPFSLSSLMFPWSSRNSIMINDTLPRDGFTYNQRTLLDILDEAIEISEEVAGDMRGSRLGPSESPSRRSSRNFDDESPPQNDQQGQPDCRQ
jgi:hypothetical protein